MARVGNFDRTVPSMARVYDYFLGGKDNFASDRAVGEKLVALHPPIIETIADSRRFVERAITWVARQGITQFLDLGAGLPTEPNTHETAQAVNPEATVVSRRGGLSLRGPSGVLLPQLVQRLGSLPGPTS